MGDRWGGSSDPGGCRPTLQWAGGGQRALERVGVCGVMEVTKKTGYDLIRQVLLVCVSPMRGTRPAAGCRARDPELMWRAWAAVPECDRAANAGGPVANAMSAVRTVLSV